MENENIQPAFLHHAVKHAAILGVISLALTLIIYAIDYTLLADWKTGLILFGVFLGYGIYAGINYRSETGGFISFGKAFQHGLLVFAVSVLISTLFNIVLYQVIDTELGLKMAEVTTEKTEEMLNGFGMSGDQLDEALEKTRQDAINRYTVAGQLKGYLWALIFCAIFALISGAIVKKKQPEMV